MPDDYTIPVEYLRVIAEHLGSIGVDTAEWLARGGMDAAALEVPEGLASSGRFRALVLASLELSNEPAAGLFIGERLVASTHGLVGAVAMNSRTVRQALEMVERFVSLRTELFAIGHLVDTEADRVTVSFVPTVPLVDIERPVLEAVLLSVKNALDEMTMGANVVDEVHFPFGAPEYAALARDIFGCSVRYGQACAAFVGDPRVLDIPLKLADPSTFDVAAAICQRELDQLAESQTFASQVRRLLLQRQNGFPSLQVAARLFHMTPRTLHRRLVAEGTSFRAQLESVRHTLALEHLKSGRFCMEEVAYRLGYSDLSNFRRAFRRWEGAPPSAYRERAHDN